MISILIDNKDLKTVYGVEVLDYTDVFSFPAERVQERTWEDKSGVDRDLSNVKYDAREFVLSCYCKASTLSAAYVLVKTFTDYLYSKSVFVLSLRDTAQGLRQCYLCSRSNAIAADLKIRNSNSLYLFKIGLKDVNPKAVKYYTSIVLGVLTIVYTKGKTAQLYWGNGERAIVSNSGAYAKGSLLANVPIDVVIDIDSDEVDVAVLLADFSANITSGIKPQTVVFTDLSTGTIGLWSWDFGDGSTSDASNPSHTYINEGIYTVSLQVFNSVGGFATMTKTNYILIRQARLLWNDTDAFLSGTTNKIITN